ncbi:MAG: type IV secretion system DNA-binding domain-containing protein [Clostridia bacterium]|nr:type IV secretion system DNA-binding domain-containing protein [Clostridia bacterium]
MFTSRRSRTIRKHFNFWKELKIMHKRDKSNVPTVKTGTFIGYSHKRPVYIPDNCKHCFVCGTTGSGKTVALSNFIKHGAESNYPMLIVDGKGDIGTGSILEVTKHFCKDSKLYVVSLSDPLHSAKYNPFRNASPTMCKDMLINMTEWSEEHYKLNTERYLQRLIILLQQNNVPISFNAIINNMAIERFNALSANLLKQDEIDKNTHLLNLEISKVCGKIAQSASARFSTIAESEFGSIFADEGIDIYTAIKENAVILFVLNPLLYPEISPLMGRLILIDAKQAVNKCFNSGLERAFYIFDEINSYASTALIDLINKSRSANITSMLATQSLADLDFACNEAFKEQVIENTNNYIVLRQNSAVNSEHWANVLGTKSTIDVTYQLQQGKYFFETSDTGLGSARRVREFYYHPDDIKALQVGKGIFMSKDMNFHSKISINKPF